MKFRYLFIILILTLPVIKVVKDYQYSKTVNKEELQFKIPVVDDYINWDTVIVNVKLDIPKYYTLKKYIRNNSDCTTCGDQSYTFFSNPTIESVAEDDTLIVGFFKQFEKGRKPDSTLLSITTYRNLLIQDIKSEKLVNEMLSNHIDRVKADAPNAKLIQKEIIIEGDFFRYIEYENKGKQNSIKCYVAFFCQKNLVLRIKIEDLTFNKQFQKDFYRILQSVKIKVEYTGENAEIKKLIN